MDFFVDKNVIMDFVKLAYFNESRNDYENQALIVLMAREGRFRAIVSENTLFSVGNYMAYKMQRHGMDGIDEKVRNALAFIFKDGWAVAHLTLPEFLECLKEKRLEYEDAYQLACAKKTGNIVTRNLKDFDKVKNDVAVFAPKSFLNRQFKSDIPNYAKKLDKLLHAE